MRRKCVLPTKFFVSTCVHKTFCELCFLSRSHFNPFQWNHRLQKPYKRFILLSYQLSVAKPKKQRRKISGNNLLHRQANYGRRKKRSLFDYYRSRANDRKNSGSRGHVFTRRPIAIMQELMNTDTRRIRSEVSNHPINCSFFPFSLFPFI